MLEALEAGTAPLTAGYKRSRRSCSCSSSSSSPPPSNAASGSGVLSKSLSLIGEGLGRMDGAVDGFVARMGRWTDDDGGDEALLLPLTRETGDRVSG